MSSETVAAGLSTRRASPAAGLAIDVVRRVTQPALAAAAVLILWEVLVRVYGIRPVLLPAPSAIYHAMVAQWPMLLQNAIPTALESLGGFLLSVVLGGLLGVLLTFSRLARDSLYPNVVLFQLIPKVAV